MQLRQLLENLPQNNIIKMVNVDKFFFCISTLLLLLYSCSSPQNYENQNAIEKRDTTFIDLDSMVLGVNGKSNYTFYLSTNIPEQTILNWRFVLDVDVTDSSEWQIFSDTLKLTSQRFILKNIPYLNPSHLFVYVKKNDFNNIDFNFSSEQIAKLNFSYCECPFGSCFSIKKDLINNTDSFIKEY